MNAPLWTSAREEKLSKLVKFGYSAAQIANELGVTRNSVLGKIHKLGLSMGRRRTGAPKSIKVLANKSVDDPRPDWKTTALSDKIPMVRAMMMQKLSPTQIASSFQNCTNKAVNAFCLRHLEQTPRFQPVYTKYHGQQVINITPKLAPVVEAIALPESNGVGIIAHDMQTECAAIIPGRGDDGLALCCGLEIHKSSYCRMHYEAYSTRMSKAERIVIAKIIKAFR